jgi:hypothetical protein
MVDHFVLDVRPVGDIELKVYREPPFFVRSANATDVPLRPNVKPIERVAVGVRHDVEQLRQILHVSVRANHVVAVAGFNVAETAAAIH